MVRVIVDPERLAARGLTLDSVRNVLEGQNLDVSGGDYSEGKRRYVVRTLSRYGKPEEVSDQLIAIQNGIPVYVRDVAQVELGFKKLTGVVRRYGDSSISVNAIRESNANVIEVMKGLNEAVAELNENLLKPKKSGTRSSLR